VTNVIVFPGRTRFLTVSVDDALYQELDPAHRRPAHVGGLLLQYRPASAFGDGEEPDFSVGGYQPSGVGCALLFDTLAGERYEQDAAGLVYRDGALLAPSAPVGFGVPRTERYSRLRLGAEAALFFIERTADGWAFAIRVTAPVLALIREPGIRSADILPTLWLSLAARALDGANWNDAGDEASGMRPVIGAASRGARTHTTAGFDT